MKSFAAKTKNPPASSFLAVICMAFEARSKLQKLGLHAPEDTRLQHIQQMQGCAFFWVKIHMQIAYRRGADLATVLREQDLCLIACVSKMSRLRFPQLYFLFVTYRSHTEWGSTTTLSSSAGATTAWSTPRISPKLEGRSWFWNAAMFSAAPL